MNPQTQADSFLAAIVSSSSDAILTNDLSGIITSWNLGAERVFGYSAAEVIGKPVTVLFPPDRIDEETGILARVQRGEVIDHYETVRRRKDGSLVDISLTVSPLRDASGQIIGASKIARNVTDLKREQDRYRSTLSAIGEALISTDAHGLVNYVNPAAEKLSGFSVASVLGKSFASVFHFIDERSRAALAINPGFGAYVSESEGASHTALLVAREGREVPIGFTSAPVYGRGGLKIGGVFAFRDVSESREKERAAARLAAIVEGSDDAIVGKTLAGVVTDWNQGAERLFGYTASEIVGKSITLLLPPERLNEEEQILARLVRGERIDHFETIRRRKNGSLVNVSITISPVRDKRGKIIGASKIARDITVIVEAQRKLQSHTQELEVQVRRRTANLQETISELEAFSYSLTHDLRAPVRSIQSFTELVLHDFGAEMQEEPRAYLAKVINAATRMDRLIQDILAFAQISGAEIKIGPLDAERLIDETIHERPEFQKPKADIRVFKPLMPLTGHEASLSQCLTNLLQNAVKFVSPGIMPIVEIFTERNGDNVRLCIRDNGIGIDRSGRDRLFAIFQRLPTVHLYQGTGVGLAIVRKSAQRMNATVGVDSTPGKGSTFWIEFPPNS